MNIYIYIYTHRERERESEREREPRPGLGGRGLLGGLVLKVVRVLRLISLLLVVVFFVYVFVCLKLIICCVASFAYSASSLCLLKAYTWLVSNWTHF